MQIFYDLKEFQDYLQSIRIQNQTIGFVPTMGALHNGHLSLIQKSNQENDITICSIFVNPTQFDNAEDLKKYPRDIEKDTALLKTAKCHAVYFPTVRDIYPDGEKTEKHIFHGLENQMEGKFRHGHFDGVATVVSRFFDIIQPNKAYFGEKDFQQLRIIQTLVEDKKHPIKIVPIPIYRAENGLALSSRNARLTPEYLAEAPMIYQILNHIIDWKKDCSVSDTIKKVEDAFRETALKLEYIMICDEKDLKPISSWDEAENIRAFVAAYAGEIRLIDNLKIED